MEAEVAGFSWVAFWVVCIPLSACLFLDLDLDRDEHENHGEYIWRMFPTVFIATAGSIMWASVSGSVVGYIFT